MKESGVLEKTALVFGQMNEPPGARMRVAEMGELQERIASTKDLFCRSSGGISRKNAVQIFSVLRKYIGAAEQKAFMKLLLKDLF